MLIFKLQFTQKICQHIHLFQTFMNTLYFSLWVEMTSTGESKKMENAKNIINLIGHEYFIYVLHLILALIFFSVGLMSLPTMCVCP